MNPLLRLLGAAASHGLLTGQIVFSAALVGACELPNWIHAPRQVIACRSPPEQSAAFSTAAAIADIPAAVGSQVAPCGCTSAVNRACRWMGSACSCCCRHRRYEPGRTVTSGKCWSSFRSKVSTLLNPNTRTCPVFRSQMDAELSKKVYGRVPVLIDEALGDKGNPWGIKFMTMFHISKVSHLFLDAHVSDRLPLYEAKPIHHYDHRWATYDAAGSNRDVTLPQKQDSGFEIIPRYWVERQEVEARLKAQGWDRQWLVGWRDFCRSSDERTVIASLAPMAGFGNQMPLMLPGAKIEIKKMACLLRRLWKTTKARSPIKAAP